MRLLNTTTRQYHEFQGSSIPPYAILSHTWADGEVSFQGFRGGKGEDKYGYKKIKSCCALAASDDWEFVWIDTCCLDKTSSAELSGAINSMFEWYRKAGVCYAYLADVLASDINREATRKDFRKSRWFTRGWTLQELLAPQTVVLYDLNWKEIGTKSSLVKEISAITGIKELDMFNFKKANIAVKMSWASLRETIRTEDTASCLMGLFGVHIPLLYGEGRNAFTRLQHEILKMSDDETIFAWDYEPPSLYQILSSHRGLLAPDPTKFRRSGDIRRLAFDTERPLYSVTNRGLQMGLLLLRKKELEEYPNKKIFLTPLNCTGDPSGRPLAIYLRMDVENKDTSDETIQIAYRSVEAIGSPSKSKLTTISTTDAALKLGIPRETIYIKDKYSTLGPLRYRDKFLFTIRFPASFRAESFDSSGI